MTLRIYDKIISDRGSRYAVSGAPACNRAEVGAVLTELRQNKKFDKATHNTWAAILSGEGVKDDDGESGAGQIILQMLERAGLTDHVVIVTRWYGGKHLGGDRFRHVVDAVRHYLGQVQP
ncbi:YigZ family protein [Paracoccus aestuariivivens]|uniref:YigZ family protein n=1 Tax=Paracoccus aestuariivivens TaxID=1820333 RepID=A0A6L6JF18_9RHOB|nr:YigZ family protein [Paracoccus aestuariivivens]MTH79845.1 YigZ family protein [Paracoccus aestuariivivens]